ncbi:hypothetical protein GJAV_G00271560 [Gymnothorax javanicus]|nr:hypothetical protein GJAV_G00271560 [Gymnothorax javanicus]
MSGSSDSVINVTSDSFWEVGNYKRVVKRVDDGSRLCSDLMACIHERARIEKSYAVQLTDWAKRWRQLVDKGPQYGTLEQAWSALMTEAEKVSELHMEVKAALTAQDLEKLKAWQKEAYHKQMIGGFKETKEAEDGFRKAQKPWAKKLKEVEAMKKAYHSACKEEKLATSRENSGRLENNPETQKKLQEKVEKCQVEMQKAKEHYETALQELEKSSPQYMENMEQAKEHYETALQELEKSSPQYMENMEQVFDQWQGFEEKRICFFKELLLEVKTHLDLSTSHRLQTIYHTLEDTIRATDAQHDLKWFSSTHGPGMHMNWPQFEAWSVDLNRSLTKREKKKPGDGVTLTGISQTEEPIATSRSSSAAPSSTEPTGSNPFEEEEDDDGAEASEGSPVSVVREEIETKTASREVEKPDSSVEETEIPGRTDGGGKGNPFEDEPSAPAIAVPVRALYDYEGQEQDELSFKAGDELLKMGEEDDQGWCRGRLADGREGLYPANYVEETQ